MLKHSRETRLSSEPYVERMLTDRPDEMTGKTRFGKRSACRWFASVLLTAAERTSELFLERVYERLIVFPLEPFGDHPAGLLVVAA